MYVSARERMILETLLSQNQEVTVQQLSDELKVSERTVHRDLKGVESILNDYHIQLLKKSGVGIQIIGQKDDLEKLQLMLYNQSPAEFTPDERQTIIFCTLLEAHEPVKLFSLADDLNVTMVTVSNDLNKLEHRLDHLGLSLKRKRGYGIEITGTETAKRKAMRDIISENVNEVEFLSLVRENIQNPPHYQTDTISKKLLGLVEKKKLIIVEKIIEEVNKEKDHTIADSAYIGLVVHLALAIERIQHGENIKMDPIYLQDLQVTSEYQIAKKIVEKLATVFNLDIPEAEIGYITMHLQGAKFRKDKEYVMDNKNLEASEKAKSLIKFVENQLNCSLSNDFSLFSGLVTHLEPALHRIERNMGIHNPMLETIKQNYQDLFDVVKMGVKVVFPGITVPDAEVGFLVLHFGSALLSDNQSISLKALIICSTGLGTSKILATRIAKEFPEVKHFKNASLFELDQLDMNDYDLVISTIQLTNFPKDYVLASPILTQEEINEIRTMIRKKKAEQMISVKSKNVAQGTKAFTDRDSAIQEMGDVKDISATILDVLENFKVTVSNKRTIKGVLDEVCLELEKNNLIQGAQPVVEALLNREKLGGLGIPDSQLALYHARNDAVLQRIFLVIGLETPLKVNSMTKNVMEISSLLLLLAPNQMSNQQAEILSFISAMIIENDESLALFESKNEDLISTHLAKRLNEWFWWKITEVRD